MAQYGANYSKAVDSMVKFYEDLSEEQIDTIILSKMNALILSSQNNENVLKIATGFVYKITRIDGLFSEKEESIVNELAKINQNGGLKFSRRKINDFEYSDEVLTELTEQYKELDPITRYDILALVTAMAMVDGELADVEDQWLKELATYC